jgi:uncharacterized protein YkwD
MGRRGALFAVSLLAVLGAVMARDAIPMRPRTSERAVAAPVAAATTVTAAPTSQPAPTTTAPAPTTSAPPVSSDEVQVAGISVTRTPESEPQPSPPPCPAPGGADFVDALLNGHRSIRCQNGVGDLALDPAVSGHAQYHAERLMAAGACSSLFHSHELPQWYPTSYWGENIACVAWARGCSSDADYIMNGWMNSDEHRLNILDPHFEFMGVGVACDGTRTYVVVQFRS